MNYQQICKISRKKRLKPKWKYSKTFQGGGYFLRSSNHNLLNISRPRTAFVQRSVAHAAPRVWNSLRRTITDDVNISAPVFIARQHTDARYWYSKSVCPSVRYVLVLYENGLRYCHNFLSYSSPIILILSALNIFRKFRRVTPCGGTKYRWGIKISRFWTNITLYLANDTRYRQSYYGNLIATHIRSII